MIPVFNEDGNLPAGLHLATLAEIEARFTDNLKRKRHFEYLKLLIDDLKAIGCKTIYIDGSFITNKVLPKDMDICWESTGVDLINTKIIMPILWDFSNARYEQQKKYHADIFPANCIEGASSLYFLDFFQFDKNTGKAKGIIKLEI
jgi:hypothetical protein